MSVEWRLWQAWWRSIRVSRLRPCRVTADEDSSVSLSLVRGRVTATVVVRHHLLTLTRMSRMSLIERCRVDVDCCHVHADSARRLSGRGDSSHSNLSLSLDVCRRLPLPLPLHSPAESEWNRIESNRCIEMLSDVSEPTATGTAVALAGCWTDAAIWIVQPIGLFVWTCVGV